jgi:hypothetical protein
VLGTEVAQPSGRLRGVCLLAQPVVAGVARPTRALAATHIGECHPRRTWARLGRVGSPPCRDQSSTSACATPGNAPESPVEGSYHAGVRSRDAAGRPDRAHAACPSCEQAMKLSNPDHRSVDTHRGQRRGGGQTCRVLPGGMARQRWSRAFPPARGARGHRKLHRPPGHGPGACGASDDCPAWLVTSACATPQNAPGCPVGKEGQHDHH